MLINVPKIGQPVLHTYRYDQLNRIKEVNNYNAYNAANNTWQATQQHKENLTFDANGNVQTALLNGNNAQLAYQNFNYNYDPVKKNRLLSITNSVNNTTSNYQYDEIGNVTKDELEGNATMDWNVYGKLSRVVKTTGSRIDFKYDASGNRIAKIIGRKEQWSVRDAGGNIMATYLKDPSINSGKLSSEAYYMYGSSMLGAWKHITDVESAKPVPVIRTFVRGEQEFYFSNQLGNNVLILSDKKTGFDDNGDGTADRYEADVLNATDYSAYGENLIGREFKSSLIQFGFNSKWNDTETGYQDYGMRIYSGRRRGFVSVDPITKKYPELTPYQFASNTPIFGIDRDGKELLGNNWLFNAFVDWISDDPIGVKSMRDGFEQKAAVQTSQMSYDNGKVPRDIKNTLDHVNNIDANIKIAKGTAKLVTFNIKTSFDVMSSIAPIGEGISVSLRGTEIVYGGIKAERVLIGSSEKIAVIGRDFDTRVLKFAAGFEKQTGKKIETFEATEEAQIAWRGLLDKYKGNVPDEIAKGSQIFKENQTWAETVKKEGYKVIVTGLGTKDAKGTFYKMETQLIFDDK